MGKYDADVIFYKDLKEQVSSTRFQRSFVWNEKKQKNLIESIKRDLPIGSLLLSKNEDEKKYLVIDGLQRITTLKNFEENKLNFVDENEIGNDQILDLINFVERASNIYKDLQQKGKDATLEEIRLIIINTLKKNGKLSTFETSYEITKSLLDNISIFEEQDYPKINLKVGEIINRINNILDVDKIKLPIIIFRGSDSEMAEVFQKLNSEGITLSKYDIFSAKWQNCTINCKNDKEILDHVATKYRETEDIGLEIENFDEESLFETGQINTFEYAYALGKTISSKSKFLYKSKKSTEVDSFGFSLLTGIFNISNKNMSELGPIMSRSNVDFSELKEKIIDSVLYLEKKLNDWVMGLNKSYIKAHSELQLASYVITHFRLHYKLLNDKIIDISKDNKNKIREFDRHIHEHYLYDIIRSYWSGTGDTKLDEIVLNNLDENRYLHGVSKNNFQNTLYSWFEEQNFKTRENFNSEVKLFINYFTKSRIITAKYHNDQFDYDHIIPKSRLINKFKKNNIKVPIASPANAVLMVSFDNRSKREKTYYELIKDRNSSIKLDEQKLDDFGYPRKDEIKFVESNETFTSTSYSEFIKNRSEFLVREFIDSFFK